MSNSLAEGATDVSWLLGNRFLQSYHQVYDYTAMRVTLNLKELDKNGLHQSVDVSDENIRKHMFNQTFLDAVVKTPILPKQIYDSNIEKRPISLV